MKKTIYISSTVTSNQWPHKQPFAVSPIIAHFCVIERHCSPRNSPMSHAFALGDMFLH